MRPIQRVPFVEETLPLVGPPLPDPNDQASAAPAAASPSAAAPPAASAASASPLLQTVAYHDPMLDIADRVAGIGQSHPAEDAQVREAVTDFVKEEAPKEAVVQGGLEPALKAAGIEQGAAKIGLGGTLEALGVGAAGLVGGVIAGVLWPKPLNEGEDEALRRMHEHDAPPAADPPPGS
jgi:hypothetical protein